METADDRFSSRSGAELANPLDVGEWAASCSDRFYSLGDSPVTLRISRVLRTCSTHVETKTAHKICFINLIVTCHSENRMRM
jgi:hypothetical protein